MKENKHRSLCITQECPIVNPVTFYLLSFPKRTCKRGRTRCNMSLLHVIKYRLIFCGNKDNHYLGWWIYLDCIITLNLTSTLPVDSVRKPYLLRYGSCDYQKNQILHSFWELLKENQFYARK